MTTPEKAARDLAGSTGGAHEQHHDTRLLIGSTDTARMLSLSARKVWQLTRDGALPSVKVDRRTLYPTAGLRAWVAAGCPTSPGSAASLDWRGGGE